MTDFIEQDALTGTTHATPPIRDHPVHEVKSFAALPRVDEGLLQKFRAWLSGDAPNTPLVYKSASGLRRMLLFTSNSYQDRDGETITSKALEEYEASCYPGEDLYHNDNPFLWWHDDEIVMGSLVSVEYIPPFLIEVAEELPHDPISKALWDFAEANGDKAGVSHRFGYLEKDRDKDGTFHHIFKQETSYLPERALAANDRTYAGVLKPMSIPESRKRMGEILKETTQVEGIEELLHTEGVPAARKRLAEQGVTHKAFPPKKAPPAVVEADAVAADDAAVTDENAVMDDEEAKDEAADDGKMDITRLMVLMNGMLDMFANMLDNESVGQTERVDMMKAFDDLKEARMTEKAQDKTTLESLMEKMKALEARQANVEARLNLAPRSITQDKGMTPEAIKDAVDTAVRAREEGETVVDPFWGRMKKLPS